MLIAGSSKVGNTVGSAKAQKGYSQTPLSAGGGLVFSWERRSPDRLLRQKPHVACCSVFQTIIKDEKTMKTKNKPVFISLARRFRRIAENRSAQRDSGIYKLADGRTGRTEPPCTPAQRDSGISILKTCPYRPCRPYSPLDFENSPAQRHSKMSNGRLSGVFCRWQCGENRPAQRNSKMSNCAGAVKCAPAQRDSGMSKLGMGLMSPMGPIGLMGQKPVMKNRPAQRDSIMSNLKIETENTPAQRDSIMSNLKIETENTPAQRHSKMSNGRLSGVLCWPHGRKTKTAPAQRHSGISKLGMGPMSPMGPIGLMGQKPAMKNSPAQRDSGMSNLKVESENTPPQPYSKMSNRVSGLICRWRSRRLRTATSRQSGFP